MDERDSHCPYLLSSETTVTGTGLESMVDGGRWHLSLCDFRSLHFAICHWLVWTYHVWLARACFFTMLLIGAMYGFVEVQFSFRILNPLLCSNEVAHFFGATAKSCNEWSDSISCS